MDSIATWSRLSAGYDVGRNLESRTVLIDCPTGRDRVKLFKSRLVFIEVL
jgi:hypothetical protein